MAEIMELLKVYKDFGVAGLFICLELFTVYAFYKDLKNSKSELVAMTEKVTTIADKATAAIVEMNRASLDVRSGMDQMRAQNNEFVSFLRGRDERRSGR